MTTQVRFRRGTTVDHSTFTGAAGEVTVDTSKNTVVIHDGSTAGGHPVALEGSSNLPSMTGNTGKYLTNNGSIASWAAAAALSANTFTGTQTGGDNRLEQWMLKDVGETFNDKGTVSSGTATFAYSDGGCQRLQVGGSLTVATSTWPPSGNFGSLLIELVNGGTAAVTWPSINWIKTDGTTTTVFASLGITLKSSGTDWIILWTRDAGSTIYGKVVR